MIIHSGSRSLGGTKPIVHCDGTSNAKKLYWCERKWSESGHDSTKAIASYLCKGKFKGERSESNLKLTLSFIKTTFKTCIGKLNAYRHQVPMRLQRPKTIGSSYIWEVVIEFTVQAGQGTSRLNVINNVKYDAYVRVRWCMSKISHKMWPQKLKSSNHVRGTYCWCKWMHTSQESCFQTVLYWFVSHVKITNFLLLYVIECKLLKCCLIPVLKG